MKEMLEMQLVELVISTLFTLITVVILPLLAKLILSKINNDKQKGIITDMFDAVSRTVGFLEVRMTQQFKEDGNWNKDTQREVLEAAIDMVIGELSDVTIKKMKLTGESLRVRVEKEIEKYLLEKKTPKLEAISSEICLTGK